MARDVAMAVQRCPVHPSADVVSQAEVKGLLVEPSQRCATCGRVLMVDRVLAETTAASDRIIR